MHSSQNCLLKSMKLRVIVPWRNSSSFSVFLSPFSQLNTFDQGKRYLALPRSLLPPFEKLSVAHSETLASGHTNPCQTVRLIEHASSPYNDPVSVSLLFSNIKWQLKWIQEMVWHIFWQQRGRAGLWCRSPVPWQLTKRFSQGPWPCDSCRRGAIRSIIMFHSMTL